MSTAADGLLRVLSTMVPQVVFAVRSVVMEGERTHEHSHADLFQLNVFVKGSGTWSVDGEAWEISRRQVYLAAPGRLHAIEPGAVLEGCTIRFRLDGYAGATLPTVLEVDDGLAERCARLAGEVVDQAAAEPVLGSLRLAEVLLLAVRHGRPPAVADVRSALTALAVEFLEAHFRERIAIRDVAALAGVSEEHLCRVFRQDTRISPMAFLQRIRVGHAAERLFRSDEPLAAIAESAGFGNLRNMRAAFIRQHQVTPQAFRDAHQEY